MSLHVVVDSQRCQGHGRCFDICPGLFVPDAEGFATVSNGLLAGDADLTRLAQRAAESCPERAISVGD
jgi:ferredoxin